MVAKSTRSLAFRAILPACFLAASSTATAQDTTVNAPSFFTQDNSSNWEPGQLLSRTVGLGRVTVVAYHNGIVYAGGFAGRPYGRFEWNNFSNASSFSMTAAAGNASIQISTTSGSHGHSGKMGDYLLGGVKRTSTMGVNIEDGDFEDDFPEVTFGTGAPSRDFGQRPNPFPDGDNRMQGATWPWALPFRWPQYGSENGDSWIYRADQLLGETWDMAESGVVGQTLLVGNILFVVSDETYSGVAAYDIGPMFNDPAEPPVLLDKLDGKIGGYLPAIWRNYLVFPTEEILQLVDFSDPSNLVYAGDIVKDANPGHGGQDYVQFQDEFAFYHGSKINMETRQTVLTLDWADSGDRPSGSVSGKLNATQYALPIGNLLVTGGRNTTGEDGVGLWVHQDEPDTTRPEVGYHIPRPNQTNYPLGAPVTLIINETLEGYTIAPGETLILREANGGAEVDAWMSFSHDDLLTITPKEYLEENTEYEVVVVDGGIKDVVGNGIVGYQFNFSTGSTSNGNSLPVVDQFTVSKSPAAPGETIQFDVWASDPDGNSVLEYRINFGDGTPSTDWSGSTNYQHVYDSEGHPEVKIQVREANNASAQSTEVITISIADPVSGPRPTKSSPIALDPANNRVWTVNPDSDSVTRINASTRTVEQEFDLRSRLGVNHSVDPRSIAVDASGNVWIACKDADTVAILNGATGALIVGVDCGYGSAPVGVAASPDGQSVFVTTEARGHEAVTSDLGEPGNGMLLRFDASSYAVGTAPSETGSLELGPMPRAIAVFGDGNRALVTRFISSHPRGGEVWDVDASSANSLSLNGTIYLPVDTTTIGSDAEQLLSSNGSGTPNYVSSITISPDQQWAWYTAVKPDTGRGQLYGNELDADNTVRTIVGRIDLSGNNPSDEDGSRIDFDNADSASAIAFSPRGDWAFVTAQGNNLIGIFDHLGIINDGTVSARNTRARLPTGGAPQGIVLGDDGQIWIQNFMDRSVSVYDLSDFLERGRTGSDPETINTVTNERLASDVLLGKQIFYHAGDARMSDEGYISCASCHIDGMGDGLVWDFTQRGEGLRNTTDLRGRAGMGHGNVHWTANFDEIQDFENDIRNEFGGHGFLTDADWETRQDPLGNSKAGRSADLDALAAYVTSLDVSHLPKSPHREFDGDMTNEAITRGAELFQSESCTTCHVPETEYTDSVVGNGLASLHDVGTLRATSGSRLSDSLTGIDTPTLLGIWNAAPYLHDGSAPTLADVFDTAGGDAYEAESAQRIGGADIRDLSQSNSVSEAVGGEAVRLNKSGHAVEWSNVAGGSGGSARISIRYATRSDTPPATVTVNGNNTSFNLERTQDANLDAAKWVTLTLNANLQSGTSNTIRINNDSNDTIWVDQLHVATQNDLAAADDHTRVADLSSDDQQALIAYLLQLDERSVSNDADPNQAPEAIISASASSGTAPLEVNLDASGSSDPDGDSLTYQWNFDDGNGFVAAFGSNPAIELVTFSAAGTYNVRVRVSDGDLNDTASVTIDVSDAPPPSGDKLTGTIIGTGGSWNDDPNRTRAAAFDGDTTTFFDAPGPDGAWVGLDLGSATALSKVRFHPRDGRANRMDGGVFQGDDNASFSSPDTLHTIGNASAGWTEVTISGSYRYVRYLSPNNGYGNVAEVEFYGDGGTGGTNVPPSADLTGPAGLEVGQNATFDASGSSDADGDSLQFAWDLDDGNGFSSFGSADTQTTSFNATGTYTVQVQISDGTDTTMASLSVDVTAPPVGGGLLTGTIIGTDGSWNDDPDRTKAAAFDGDTSTFFDAPGPDGAWVGLDLGSATSLSKVRFHPRDGRANRMDGGVFQGDDNASFSSPDTLYTISNASAGWSEVNLSGSYRYVRYLSPNNGYGNVAEVEFFGDGGTGGTNTAPVADLTGPTSLETGENGSFDASGSSDADNDALTYEWDLGTGSFGSSSSSSSQSTSFSSAGTYTIRVRVSDGTDTDTASATVTVTDPPPSGNTVTLDFESQTTGDLGSNQTIDGFDLFTYRTEGGGGTLQIVSHNGSQVANHGNWGRATEFTKNDGSSFDFVSFDWSSRTGQLTDVIVTGYANGSVVEGPVTFTSSSTTLATETLNWTNVDMVRLDFINGQSNRDGYFDNLVFE